MIGKPRCGWEEEENTKWTRKKEHIRTWTGFIIISGRFYRNGKERQGLKIYGTGHRFGPCHVSDTQMTVSQLGARGFVQDYSV